jgi:hypothetical protein
MLAELSKPIVQQRRTDAIRLKMSKPTDEQRRLESGRFMIAVYWDDMVSYPEFVREPDDPYIEELVKKVRAQGWLVRHRDTPSPTLTKPNRVLRTFFIPGFCVITESGERLQGAYHPQDDNDDYS